MTTTTPAKVEYYKDYDDPAADLVIKVKDGVKSRVHSYLLKAHSQYFRDMPDHDEKMCGTTPKEIDFETEAKILALLLDLIDGRVIQASQKWSDLGEVLEVGAQYRFLHIGPLVLNHLERRTPSGDPWKVFVIASNLDLPALARRALVDFGNTPQIKWLAHT